MLVKIVGKQVIKGKDGKPDSYLYHGEYSSNFVDGVSCDRFFVSQNLIKYEEVDLNHYYSLDYDRNGYLISICAVDNI